MQNDLPENMDFFDEHLKRSFTSWNPEFQEEKLWNELSESIDFEQELNEKKQSFEKEEVFVPAGVWDKINSSLDKEFVDNQLRESFNKWDETPSESVFEKLDESLQLEKVWSGLDKDINSIINKKTNIYFQLIASLILVLLSFYTRDNLAFYSKIEKNMHFSLENNLAQNREIAPETTSVGKIELSKQTQKQVKTLPRIQKPISETGILANSEVFAVKEKKTDEHNHTEINSEAIDKLDFYKLKKLDQNPIDLKLGKLNIKMRASKTIQLGLNYFSAINIISQKTPQALSSNRSGLGHEFGLFVSHPLRQFNQEYFFNFVMLKQIENSFKNGVFAQSNLNISGFKLNTLTTYPLNSKFTLGAGLSAFFPTQAIKQREQVVLDFPEINPINLGFNICFDVTKISFLKENKLALGLKYENMFSLHKETSSFKNFQNISLGLKYKF